MTTERTHEEFLDHLAPIVDGEPATLERFADHMADHDAARDLRHDAVDVAEALGQAGADFEVPADLDARLLAAIDARGDALAVDPPP